MLLIPQKFFYWQLMTFDLHILIEIAIVTRRFSTIVFYEVTLNVINGSRPSLALLIFISLSPQTEGGGLEKSVHCLQILDKYHGLHYLHSPSGEGRGQGELSR